jgi:alpha-methylacyl-CoA racemase
VLSLAEAPHHPHNTARGTFVEVDGVAQPAPTPRFSRTAPNPPRAPEAADSAALADWGFSGEDIARLQSAGAL